MGHYLINQQRSHGWRAALGVLELVLYDATVNGNRHCPKKTPTDVLCDHELLGSFLMVNEFLEVDITPVSVRISSVQTYLGRSPTRVISSSDQDPDWSFNSNLFALAEWLIIFQPYFVTADRRPKLFAPWFSGAADEVLD